MKASHARRGSSARHATVGAAAVPPEEAFVHAPWSEALLDPTLPVPGGLKTWNGSDPAVRFGVYRNNVLHSLTDVLAAGFPVVRELVGADCFAALARTHVQRRPPASPVMSEYGDGFDATLTDLPELAAWPWLAGVARLERARVQALHAADAAPLSAEALAEALLDPEALGMHALVLHPSLTVLVDSFAVVSIWAAHQQEPAARDAALAALDTHRPEACAVLRDGDDVLVLPLPPADAALLAALAAGTPLAQAAADHAGADLASLLALLMRHHAWCATTPVHTAATAASPGPLTDVEEAP